MDKSNLASWLLISLGAVTITTHVYAANECGTATAAGMIVCNGDASPTSDSNPYANGISYTINGLTLDISAAATQITTGNAVGLHIQGTGNNPIQVNLPNTLTLAVSGTGQHDAVRLRQTGTGAVIINSASTILTTGLDGDGLLAWISNITNSQPINIIASGTIETQASSAAGVFGYTTGTGNISISSSAAVTTTAVWSDAVSGWIDNTSSTASITLDPVSGTISTLADNSPGISIYHAGGSTGSLQVVNTADISTSGATAHGIVLSPYGAATNSITTNINVTSGSITTSDTTSDGILSDSNGSGVSMPLI